MILSPVFFLFAVSCEDFIAVDPPDTSLVQETVFSSDTDAATAMSGMYGDLIQSRVYTSQGILIYAGRYSDLYLNYSSRLDDIEFGESSILPSNGMLRALWQDLYQSVFRTNAIIEGLTTGDVTDSLAIRYQGEARFLRAFTYFHLVNLWGDVPMTTTTETGVNAILPRTNTNLVYDQIIEDLEFGINVLPVEYYSRDGLRSRPTSLVAEAFLSKVNLFMNNWPEAEISASTVLNSGFYALELDLNSVFANSSMETIWHFQSIFETIPTFEGVNLILNFAPPIFGVSLRDAFITEFESSDLRLENWIASVSSDGDTFYYPFKYKVRFGAGPHNELQSAIRLAEIYLIRAEARAQQGNIDGALADLNAVRNRAGLANSTASSQQEVLEAIYQERKFELFSEGASRWLDLVRTGRATSVLQPIKPDWRETAVLWPIPESEFENNPNLGAQNPGY